MHEEHHIGQHRMAFDPPDTVRITYVGDVTLEEGRRMHQTCWHLITGCQYILVLVNLARLGTIPPEVRNAMVEGLRGIPVRGTAIVGATFEKRVLSGLINRGLNLVLQLDNPLRFFDTEERAREWLRERRAIVLAQPC